MKDFILQLSLLLLAGCAAGDGQLSSLSLADWGGVGAAVLTGITGLNAWRNKTRSKALTRATGRTG